MDRAHDGVADGTTEFDLDLSEFDEPIILGAKDFRSIFKSIVTLSEELSS